MPWKMWTVPRRFGILQRNCKKVNEWRNICHRDPAFFSSKHLSYSNKIKKKGTVAITKKKKFQEYSINLSFYFLISEPLHLEIKVLLGFDLESSEVKGRFPL